MSIKGNPSALGQARSVIKGKKNHLGEFVAVNKPSTGVTRGRGWILQRGYWNDDGVWDDTKKWND